MSLLAGARVDNLAPSLAEYMAENRGFVDEALDRYVPGAHNEPRLLHEAMRYSLFAGGKRLRPILAIASFEIVGDSNYGVMPLAAALECVHTYSLIHDDLPAMDDDDLRRGKPTSHKKYGEAVAILAGDALITLAFEILSSPEFTRMFPHGRVLAVIRDVAQASGSTGLIAGQVWDMWFEGRVADEQAVNRIILNKTGALIRSSLTSGARLAGANLPQLKIFSIYGEKLGMAFQIRDDLLDLEGDTERLGKNVQKDGKRGKATYPSLFGADKARNMIDNLLSEAANAIEPLGERAETLRLLTEYIGQRMN